MAATNKTCRNCETEFVVQADDASFYEKIGVPTPALCPECRYRRRLLDRNEWSLYRRKCDLTGEQIISIYHENAPFPVYKPEVWRGDDWDPLEYGRDFDFSRPFFEQYEELRRAVPHMALVAPNSVNSEYSNQSQDNKDCYMVTASNTSEKCMYGNWYQGNNFWSSDCYMIEKSELCYECTNCGRCQSCVWARDCFDCVACSFCEDCRGCSDCFGCAGLRNKRYCWFNEQLSKEEYEKRLADFDWSRENIAEARARSQKLALGRPKKYFHGSKASHSTGDYLENTERIRLTFNCRGSKDGAYSQDAWEMNDSLDNTEILGTEQSYEIQGCAHVHNSMVIRSCWTISDCAYCDMCFGCNNCFGCFGLKQKEYCIFNKQYSKEDYEALKARIVEHMKETGEWGEYYPPEYSPFGYNESVAQDFFPLTKTEAEKAGFQWREPPTRDYRHTLTAADLPPKISETKDDILQQVIRCATQDSEEEKKKHPVCATAFKLIPMELELYRKLNIPVPDKCFPCRRTDRFAARNSRRLWSRTCACAGAGDSGGKHKNAAQHFHGDSKCPNEFETSYAPGRLEIIYCEQCYNTEVV